MAVMKLKVVKERPEGLVRMDFGNGLVIYPKMPGDEGYDPTFDQSLREMKAAKTHGAEKTTTL